MNVAWTPLAEQRTLEIVRDMRTDRTGAAWRWLQALLARVRGVSRYSGLGDGLWECWFEPCRIIFRIERDQMVILTLHRTAARRPGVRYPERLPEAPRAGRARS